MQSKALLIGARPSPFEGPWIPVSEGDEWEVVGSLPSGVIIETTEDPGNAPAPEAGTRFSASYARGVIMKKITDVESISIEIRRVQ